MAFLISLCAVLSCAFILQVDADVQLPHDHSLYKSILNHPPYFSYCDPSWPSFFDISLSSKLNVIADKYNIRLSDLYQFYALIEMNMPNLETIIRFELLEIIAAEMQTEMIRRQMFYLPLQPSCYPMQHSHPPSPLYTISKRSPAMPLNAASYVPVSSSYNAYTNIDMMAYAYKNLYSMLDRMMPNLPISVTNNLSAAFYNIIPQEYHTEVRDFISQLNNNIRFNLGLAEKFTPKL